MKQRVVGSVQEDCESRQRTKSRESSVQETIPEVAVESAVNTPALEIKESQALVSHLNQASSTQFQRLKKLHQSLQAQTRQVPMLIQRFVSKSA
ncbi:hypothetical protein MRB53_040629 [Persea americana]|nr:hypothetical protein MRB53_040629 [Persea americana]